MIDHPRGGRPRKGTGRAITSGVTSADDLAAGVHRHGLGGAAAESAEVDHPTRWRPRERMGLANSRDYATDDLAIVTYRLGQATGTDKRHTGHPTRRRPQERL